jgi:hypothetical protein
MVSGGEVAVYYSPQILADIGMHSETVRSLVR